jgi:hypothetical protein
VLLLAGKRDALQRVERVVRLLVEQRREHLSQVRVDRYAISVGLPQERFRVRDGRHDVAPASSAKAPTTASEGAVPNTLLVAKEPRR